MPTYTTLLRTPFDTLSPEDENFIEELLKVALLFRPFSEAMDEFISSHGYDGSLMDTEEKARWLCAVFEHAGMKPPRDIQAWYTKHQPIERDTAFQICFAFGLDGMETDEFFRRIYARERSFDCHRMQEAVYYFCLNNELPYSEARDILEQIPLSKVEKPDGSVVYTASIITDLNRLETKEELIDYLKKNIWKFTTNNATAYKTIRQLWEDAAGHNGLLIRESQRFVSSQDDVANGQYHDLRMGTDSVKPWDAYLAIFQLEKKSVSRLETDRSIKPILGRLHEAAQDSFPDRQGIDRILRGEHVSYERVRKWLILLTFYTFWVKKALADGDYSAGESDHARCLAFMDQVLTEAGYPELYVGNPYDWIFLYASKDTEPLRLFREIWNCLLGMMLQ